MEHFIAVRISFGQSENEEMNFQSSIRESMLTLAGECLNIVVGSFDRLNPDRGQAVAQIILISVEIFSTSFQFLSGQREVFND